MPSETLGNHDGQASTFDAYRVAAQDEGGDEHQGD